MNETLERVFGPEYLKIQTVFKRDERNLSRTSRTSLVAAKAELRAQI
jgi:hypothetical protein